MSNSLDPDLDRHSRWKMFAKVISIQQKLPLARKELKCRRIGTIIHFDGIESQNNKVRKSDKRLHLRNCDKYMKRSGLSTLGL